MYACTYVSMYMYVCMHVCMHACLYVCMYVCMFVCMHAYMHTACMCVCMHACVCVCVHVRCMYRQYGMFSPYGMDQKCAREVLCAVASVCHKRGTLVMWARQGDLAGVSRTRQRPVFFAHTYARDHMEKAMRFCIYALVFVIVACYMRVWYYYHRLLF